MTPDPVDQRAVPLINRSFEVDDVINEMISRGSTVTKAEALSVIEEYTRAIEVLVKDGNSVRTPLFNLLPAIVGVFANPDDSFDPARHSVKLRIRPGRRLRQMERDFGVEKTPPDKATPTLLHFYDNVTGSEDEVITPDRGGRIVGTLLKYDESDIQQGVFFVNVDSGEATRLNGQIMRNKPGELIFTNPDLAPGVYRLEVRAKLTKNAVRTGALDTELTVN